VHDRLDAVPAEGVGEAHAVDEVPLDQAAVRHGLGVAGDQVVEHPDVMPGAAEVPDRVAPDVSRAADDENSHGLREVPGGIGWGS
jgi:hypothetical protein